MTTQANLYIDQGTDFLISLDLFTDEGEEFPTDDYEFFASARKLYSTNKAFDIETRLITDDDDPNNFELYISPEKTANTEPGKYTYDVLMRSDNGVVDKILEGIIFIIPTITRIE